MRLRLAFGPVALGDAFPLGAHAGVDLCQSALEELKREREPFDPARTLLVDDSHSVLRSARRYGIAHLLSVRQPDSRRPPRDMEEFAGITSFREIMPGDLRGEA